SALGVAFIALALANRVWEVPKVPEPFDVAAFESQYPSRAENPVRSELYSAGSIFDMRKSSSTTFAHVVEATNARALTEKDLFAAAEFGWPKDNPSLDAEVESVCRGRWMKDLREVAELPPTVVDDPRDMVLSQKLISFSVRDMCRWLAARALQ